MEHVALASFRAIEHRRPLVRSTTTGISAIIDPVGRFAKRTGQWTKETLVGRIPMMQGRTAYAVLGDWLGCLCAILVLLSIGRGYQLIRRCPENKHITDRKEKKRSKRPKKS
jgi:apolipoprotein N-acyltransferase